MESDSKPRSKLRSNVRGFPPIVEKNTSFASKIQQRWKTFISDERCRFSLLSAAVLILLASIGLAIGIPVSKKIKSQGQHAFSPVGPPTPALVNDVCYNAVRVKSGTYRLDSVVGAHDETSLHLDTSCGASGSSKGVWYQYLGTGRFVTFDTCVSATSFHTEIRVFSGSCRYTTCCAIAPVSCSATTGSNMGYSVTWFAYAGEMFYVLISGYNGAEGSFGLTVT